MEALMHLAGYLICCTAVAGIVVGIEALNERCPHAPFRRGERRIPVPIKSHTAVDRLRRPRP
jgi:hypothetical protein